MQKNPFAPFVHGLKLLLDMNLPGIFHRNSDGLGDNAKTVFRHQRRCLEALRCMQLAKRAGQKPRVFFRFATHIPHRFFDYDHIKPHNAA